MEEGGEKREERGRKGGLIINIKGKHINYKKKEEEGNEIKNLRRININFKDKRIFK